MDGLKLSEEAPCKKKVSCRGIVSWTPQEDDLLRVQVGIHGTDNWPCIAAQFKDKTSRQCRRRWYTYLNSECKKGGWSPEEDRILCEAQKVFGNRWTEIAKVVAGRTDNAVKNRFTTICKKRSKHEALSKENDRRVTFQNICITAMATESTAPIKRFRYQISNLNENEGSDKRLITQSGKGEQHVRPPLAVLVQNLNNMGSLLCDSYDSNSAKGVLDIVQNNRFQGSFLKKDDPKITALMQQAELLSSLALKVNTDGTDQSFENAWKELQDYLIRIGEKGLSSRQISESNFLFNDFKDLIKDLRSSTTGSELLVRHFDLHDDSQGSSEYSTGSTNHSNTLDNKKDQHQSDECSMNHSDEVHGHHEDEMNPSISTGLAGLLSPCKEQKESDGHISAFRNSEFSSPLQMIPFLQSSAEGIPSPKFTASEQRFLLSALGLSSPSLLPNPNQNSNPSRQPSCKRALLQSL